MVGSNWPPIGNPILRTQWSRDRWRHVTRKVKSWPQYIWSLISQKLCAIDGWFKLTTILRIQWSPDRWRHVTPKGQYRDPDIFEARYLDNRERYMVGSYWSPIGNHTLGIQWSHDWWPHVTRLFSYSGNFWLLLKVGVAVAESDGVVRIAAKHSKIAFSVHAH